MDRISEQYTAALTLERKRALARDRQLPPSAFDDIELGWDGRAYTVTVRNDTGRAVDIRSYSLAAESRRVMSTKGAEVGLLGAHLLSHSPGPVYICEGEWDGCALAWLLRHLEKRGVVLAVPGAGIFKAEWAPWLTGRAVHVLFDHDSAGRDGEQKLYRLLRGVVGSLAFLHWPDSKRNGYDVRDFIVALALKKKKPVTCWKKLRAMFRPDPRLGVGTGAPELSGNNPLDVLKKEWVYAYEIKRMVYVGPDEQRAFYMLDKESFSDMHADKFPVGTKREAAHQMLVGGCTKVARPAYLPNKPKRTTERVDGTELPVVNLWIPSDITTRSADITPYLAHTEFIIPERHVRQTVLDAFAFWCRSPHIKTNWALFLGGLAGLGKDLMVWPVGQTLGRSNYGTPTPNDLENNYTDWLAHRKLIIVDTIRFSGKQSLMENLKPWIASPPERLRINGKFVPQYEIANLVAFIFMANRPDALKLDPDDRRFFVYWSHAKPKPAKYYRQLWEWMRTHVGAVAHYLLHEHEISERFDPLTPPPMTAAKREMIAASEGPLLQLLRAAWDEGRDPLRRELVQVREIESYLAEHHPQLRQTSPHAIGQALRELGAEKLSNRLQLTSGERPHVWALAQADTYAAMSHRTLTAEYQRQRTQGSYRTQATVTITLAKK